MTPVAESPATVESDEEWFGRWRDRELGRLERNGVCYLDYTGAALYPASLVRADTSRLEAGVFGNPHSEHLPSRQSSTDLDAARRAILEFLGARSPSIRWSSRLTRAARAGWWARRTASDRAVPWCSPRTTTTR